MNVPTVTIDTNRANTQDAKYRALLERRSQIVSRLHALQTRITDLQAEYASLDHQLENVCATINVRADDL